MSDLLKKIRKYIQIAHDSAEARHDAYGEDYMSSGLWALCWKQGIYSVK